MDPFFYTYLPKEQKALSRFVLNVIAAVINFLLLSSDFCFAGSNDPALQAQARQWLSKQNESGFLENRGQMMDMEGSPVPFVLFKAEAPRLNLWITEKGITLQTLKIEEEKDGYEKDKEQGRKLLAKEEEEIKIYWERIDMELKGASIKKENIIKEEPSRQGHYNYFYPHCPNGIYGVKEYSKITIKDVYPGIDWVWYASSKASSQRGIKYDFVVHPGTDYKQIELLYKSKTPIKINEQGELELYTRYGNIKENTPVSFYEGKEVETKFKLNEQRPVTINGDSGYETSISFYLPPMGELEGGRTLVIDPQLFWATFYGGNALDGPMSIDTDTSGNVFVTGYTNSTNFPVQNTGAFFQGSLGGAGDAIILKFDNTGNPLWATYYGGSGDEIAHSLATDASGNVFVTGLSDSQNFPVQNAIGAFFQGTNAGNYDAFILKFDNNGTRLWATYYGGNGYEYVYSICTDASGNVFVTGFTDSQNFPVQNAIGAFFQGTNAGNYDAFILKFDNNGTRIWATYYGGNGYEVGRSNATDASGNVFVTGYTTSTNFPLQNATGAFFQGTYGGGGSFGFGGDAFILKFDNLGNRLWATYYGGNLDEEGNSIATDASGNVFVTGHTNSTNFPIQNAGAFFQGTFGGGTYDAFILKFDNLGNRLWATYYGGSGSDGFSSYDNLVTDNCGNVYVSFETNANPFPHLTNSCDAGYYDNTYNGGTGDVVLSLFSNSGTLLWCTYLGGNGADFREVLAIDPNNNLFVSGEWTNVTNSATYPVTDPGGGAYYDPTFNGLDDGFIAKFCNNACICSPYNGCVVSGTLAVNTSSTNVPCNGQCTGTATANPSGGSSPYTYLWNTTPVQTTQTATGLCAGSYTVTVTDAVSATTTATVTITQPAAALTATVSSTSQTCTQGGTATANATGGTAPYTYQWCNGASTSSATGLSAGTCTVLVTDANGCTTLDTVNITVISGHTVTTSSTPQICTQGGTASVSATGGTAPYTYQWCNGQTASTATGLSAGSCTVLVTDANGCTTLDTVNITAVGGHTVTTSSTPQTCTQGGAATANATGGTSPYTYSWCNGQTTSTATGLSAGSCTVLVTDANGCTTLDTVNITAVGGHTVTTSSTPQTCTQGGTATANATGGTSPYTYSWCNGATTSSATGLSAGTCTVLVTDANGCTTLDTVTITTSGNIPVVNATSTPATCNGSNGTATANVNGGASPYTYLWNNGDTTSSATGLSAGAYTVTVTDNAGCTQTATVAVTQTGGPTATATASPITITQGQSVTLVAGGGGTYLWSNGSTDNPLIAAPSVTTVYCVTVSDTNNCTDTACITITVNPEPINCNYSDEQLFIPDAFSPNGDTKNDVLEVYYPNISCIKEFFLAIYDRWGEKVFESNSIADRWDGTYKGNLMNTAVFVYYMKVTFITGNETIRKGNVSIIR